MINLDAVLTAYIEESVKRNYDDDVIGRELVAVRNAFDKANVKKEVR